MTLFYKLKRLVKADAHALVEGLEEPRWILDQLVRDMEAELENTTLILNEKRQGLHVKTTHAASNREFLKKTERDADLAFEEKREDLAKAMIKRLIICERQSLVLQDEIKTMQQEVEECEKALTEKHKLLDEILRRRETVVMTSSSESCTEVTRSEVRGDGNLDHEVEIEFLRRLRARKEAV